MGRPRLHALPAPTNTTALGCSSQAGDRDLGSYQCHTPGPPNFGAGRNIFSQFVQSPVCFSRAVSERGRAEITDQRERNSRGTSSGRPVSHAMSRDSSLRTVLLKLECGAE